LCGFRIVLDEVGRRVDAAEIGEFRGIRKDGSVRGLLFPASVAVVGDWAYVTNLALVLTPNAGDEAEEDVTGYTIARVKLPKPRSDDD